MAVTGRDSTYHKDDILQRPSLANAHFSPLTWEVTCYFHANWSFVQSVTTFLVPYKHFVRWRQRQNLIQSRIHSSLFARGLFCIPCLSLYLLIPTFETSDPFLLTTVPLTSQSWFIPRRGLSNHKLDNQRSFSLQKFLFLNCLL